MPFPFGKDEMEETDMREEIAEVMDSLKEELEGRLMEWGEKNGANELEQLRTLLSLWGAKNLFLAKDHDAGAEEVILIVLGTEAVLRPGFDPGRSLRLLFKTKTSNAFLRLLTTD